jgi:hypothetical protein
MKESADKIDPHLERMVKAGVSGLDIMHGELKNQILIAEQEYDELVKQEEADDYSDAMLSIERKYAEGILDAYVHMYKLTYDLSFAISAKEAGE